MINNTSINDEMIHYHLSKTKMKDFLIEEVNFVKMIGFDTLVRASIRYPNSNKVRRIVLQISKMRVREETLNKLLR